MLLYYTNVVEQLKINYSSSTISSEALSKSFITTRQQFMLSHKTRTCTNLL